MMPRVARTLSLLILLLASINLIGFGLMESEKVKFRDGFWKDFFSFPSKMMEVFESNEIKNIPPFFEMEHFFEPFNHLDRDVYALNSFYQQEDGTWEVHLFNFRNDSTHYKWVLPKDKFVQTDRLYANSDPRNPILLPNRHLITNNDESNNLYRLDDESNVVWHNTEKRYHHAMNLDADGDIWICSTEPRHVEILRKQGKVKAVYDDNFITKVDVKTGEILQHISTSDILIENGYRNWVYGFSHVIDGNSDTDPLHLNDIEPVLEDGLFWKKGDVFLSFRHRSLVLLYRPSSNKVVRMIHGPFLRQHDVDILNDSVISIFNNEGSSIGKRVDDEKGNDVKVSDKVGHSFIVHYNLADSSFSTPFKHHFQKHKIFTDTQGFHQLLSNGSLYVEQHGHGIMFFMTEKEVLYKKQGPNRMRGYVERPHWVRIYEEINF